MVFSDHRLTMAHPGAAEKLSGVSLVMNEPDKAGPALRVETEWEKKQARPFSVLEWDGCFRLYYKTQDSDGNTAFAFAVSDDGVDWERPALDAVKWKGEPTNIADIDGCDPNEACIFVDPNGPDEHRFKAVVHRPSEGGMYLLSSPDGVRFKRAEGFLLPFIVDNHNSSFFDSRIGRYVVYSRGCDRQFPKPPVDGCRSVIRAETDTLLDQLPFDRDASDPWPPQKRWEDSPVAGIRRINRELPVVFECDGDDPPEGEIYQLAAIHYLENLYLAFPSFYSRFPWPPEWKYVNDGILDLQFAVSTDGISWERSFRSPYVRLDLPDGPCTKMMHMLSGLAPSGHVLHQYYAGGKRSHGEGRVSRDVNIGEFAPTAIGDPFAHRATQRLDGFVSADSEYSGGSVITKPITIESDILRLNIDTSASGEARVALLGDNGRAVPGFDLKDCPRIQGNDTAFEVSFTSNKKLAALKSTVVKVLVESRATKLYSVNLS